MLSVVTYANTNTKSKQKKINVNLFEEKSYLESKLKSIYYSKIRIFRKISAEVIEISKQKISY